MAHYYWEMAGQILFKLDTSAMHTMSNIPSGDCVIYDDLLFWKSCAGLGVLQHNACLYPAESMIATGISHEA